MITITVTGSVSSGAAAIEEMVKRGVANAAYDIERAAKQNLENSPRRVHSSDLRRSIQTQVDDYEAAVTSNLEYAPYVHEGTGIYARSGGRTDVPWHYYSDAVGHFVSTEGMEPNPFLENAMNTVAAHIADYFHF